MDSFFFLAAIGNRVRYLNADLIRLTMGSFVLVRRGSRSVWILNAIASDSNCQRGLFLSANAPSEWLSPGSVAGALLRPANRRMFFLKIFFIPKRP